MSQFHSRKETAADKARCAKCAWRQAKNGAGSDAGSSCGYSADPANHSRVYLHYQRTGKESLDGFTFGADCTEYKSRAQAEREKQAKIKRDQAEREKRARETNERVIVPLDKDAWAELRKRHTAAEIAEAAGICKEGIWKVPYHKGIRRGTAQAIRDKFGIDVEAKR